MSLIKKYQDGSTFTYKPTLTAAEVAAINQQPGTALWSKNTKSCASDACKAMSDHVWPKLGAPSIYKLMDAAKIASGPAYKQDDFSNRVFVDGATSSWHSAGAIHKFLDGQTYYNSLKDKPENLESALKSAPIGAFILLGPDNDEHPTGFSGTQGFANSNHTLIKYGSTDTGEPLLLDGYSSKIFTPKDLKKAWEFYTVQTVIAPKAYTSLNDYTNKRTVYNPVTQTTSSAPIEPVNFSAAKYFANTGRIAAQEGLEINSGDMAGFFKSLQQNGDALAAYLRLDPDTYKNLAATAGALALTETKGGVGLRGFSGWKDKNLTSSQGLTQINLNNIAPEHKAFLKSYGINDKRDLVDPRKAAIATMVHLADLSRNGVNLYKQNLAGSEIPGQWRTPKNRINDLLHGNISGALDAYTPAYTTKGNEPLTLTEILAYAWRSPKMLKRGDAQGSSEYVKNVQKYKQGITDSWVGEEVLPLPESQKTNFSEQGFFENFFPTSAVLNVKSNPLQFLLNKKPLNKKP
jgi:hypothetical protein